MPLTRFITVFPNTVSLNWHSVNLEPASEPEPNLQFENTHRTNSELTREALRRFA
jgi:hypothetical protein